MNKMLWLKKHFRLILLLVILWGLLLATVIKGSIEKNKRIASIVSEEQFIQEASVERKDDWVGANIWLKQEIHGTKDIKYRYVVKTDCPSWDYETRYMTTEPIPWINETSAVEVIIYDTSIRYNGTIYANSQYFLIPILNNLASETVSVDEWEQGLVKQAYEAYVADIKADNGFMDMLTVFVIAGPVLCAMCGMIFFGSQGHDTVPERKSGDIDH